LLGRRTVRRHRSLLSSRVVALNQTGWEDWDQVFIEYNGFFGEARERFSLQLNALLQDLAQWSDWDELRLAGLQQSEYEAALTLSSRHGLRMRLLDQRVAPYRKLMSDRAAGSVLAGLSANLRGQLRRSQQKLIEAVGPLRLVHAQDPDQAWQWLEHMAPWHLSQWRRPDGSSTSGFSNPAFIRFHKALIAEAFQNDQARIWQLQAGEHVVSTVYNLRTSTTESFYLGALNPGVDSKFQGGLLAHVSIMDRCLQEGLQFYDFMAGDSRYKRQLSTDAETLYWIVLQRPRLRFAIEDRLRTWRHVFTGRTPGNSPP
jgi:CelD/BcsL family acetyltransferase involved in cellulose biosynthesis